MGILHLAGLGNSPGAVTCGLSYLTQQAQRTTELGKIVDEVVVFTSAEVASGQFLPTTEVIWNHIGTRRVCKTWPAQTPVATILRDFFAAQFPDARLSLCVVDLNHFFAILQAVALVVLRFHPRDKVGRHIQINLTGGSNLLNAALFHVANLSGAVAKFYYTLVGQRSDVKYLTPVSTDNPGDFRYQEIPLLMTSAQPDALLVDLLDLLVAQAPDAWMDATDLRTRLSYQCGEGLAEGPFVRNYLNVLDGQFIERRGQRGATGCNPHNDLRITSGGRTLHGALRSLWFRALHSADTLSPEQRTCLLQDLSLETLYP